MTNYARVINGVAVDVSTDPENSFHPLLAVEFVEVPDDVVHGSRLADGVWIAPTPALPPEVVVAYQTITPETFLQLFTYQEVKAVEALVADPANDELAYWWKRLNSDRLTEVQMGLPSVQAALNGLVVLGVITEERLAQMNAIQLV